MFLMRYSCVVVLCAVALNCRAEMLNGILYSDQSGPSGRGSGQVEIAVQDRIYEVRYRKPIAGRFSESRCQEPGAVWSINVSGNASVGFRMLNAACDGHVDPLIHGAWLTVKGFLSDLPGGSDRAIETIAKGLRGKEDFHDIEAKIKELRTDSYNKFGSEGRCLAVVSKPEEDSVEIEAADDCYLNLGDHPVSLRFRVSRISTKTGWVITEIHFE
jgi:hypothetical protein